MHSSVPARKYWMFGQHFLKKRDPGSRLADAKHCNVSNGGAIAKNERFVPVSTNQI
jgi:hypothetical protein